MLDEGRVKFAGEPEKIMGKTNASSSSPVEKLFGESVQISWSAHRSAIEWAE